MITFYRTTTTVSQGDEFTDYEGYSKEQAINAANNAYRYLTDTEKETHDIIVQEYSIPKTWEELDDNEQIEILTRGGNTIEWK